jgi:hypothetical protein
MSAYYPLLLSGSSLVVCFWAEVSTHIYNIFLYENLNFQVTLTSQFLSVVSCQPQTPQVVAHT